MLKTARLYLHSSGHNTGTWRTDGQTDGRNPSSQYSALHLRAVRTRCKNLYVCVGLPVITSKTSVCLTVVCWRLTLTALLSCFMHHSLTLLVLLRSVSRCVGVSVSIVDCVSYPQNSRHWSCWKMIWTDRVSLSQYHCKQTSRAATLFTWLSWLLL